LPDRAPHERRLAKGKKKKKSDNVYEALLFHFSPVGHRKKEREREKRKEKVGAKLNRKLFARILVSGSQSQIGGEKAGEKKKKVNRRPTIPLVI